MSISVKIIGGTAFFVHQGSIGIILDVNRVDNDSIIRQKWIQLSKEHHPDNLMVKASPREFVDHGNNELTAINLAYVKIKNEREFN